MPPDSRPTRPGFVLRHRPRWQEGPTACARLGGVLIDHYAPDEPRLPDIAQGPILMWMANVSYAREEPTSLNTMAILPQLIAMGVRAFMIEGRQRSAAYGRCHTYPARGDRRCLRCRRAKPDFPAPAGMDPGAVAPCGRAQTTLVRSSALAVKEPPMDAPHHATRDTSVAQAPALSHLSESKSRRFGLTVGPVLYLWSRARLLTSTPRCRRIARRLRGPGRSGVRAAASCAPGRLGWRWRANSPRPASRSSGHASAGGTEADLRPIERHADLACHAVEAGDASALALLHGRAAGAGSARQRLQPGRRLREHADLGVLRWCRHWSCRSLRSPYQPGGTAGADLTAAPWSPRCGYLADCLCRSRRVASTARHAGVPARSVRLPCMDDPDGRLVCSTEGQSFPGAQRHPGFNRPVCTTCWSIAGAYPAGYPRAVAAVIRLHVRRRPRRCLERGDQPAEGRLAGWAEPRPHPLRDRYAFGGAGTNAVVEVAGVDA